MQSNEMIEIIILTDALTDALTLLMRNSNYYVDNKISKLKQT